MYDFGVICTLNKYVMPESIESVWTTSVLTEQSYYKVVIVVVAAPQPKKDWSQAISPNSIVGVDVPIIG